MIIRLLRHAQGQTLAEFWSPQATGANIYIQLYWPNDSQSMNTIIPIYNSVYFYAGVLNKFVSLINHKL